MAVLDADSGKDSIAGACDRRSLGRGARHFAILWKRRK